MGNIKRVRDSKKRAVRQGKEQVWLVDGEKVVNTNHGFAEATGTDVVYDSSWEEPQEPLQVYDNGREEVEGGGGSGVTLTGLGADYLEVYNGSSNTIRAFYTPADGDTSNITLSSDSEYVSVSGRVAGPGDYCIQVVAHSDDAYATISVSDGTNTLYFGVQCVPFVNVESIGNPTPSEIDVAPNTAKYVEISYSPSDATSPAGEVVCNTVNSSVLGYGGANGVIRTQIGYYGEDVDGQLIYYLNSDPEDTKTVTVHNVTPSVLIESLTGVPQTVQNLAPGSFRSFSVTYGPNDADHIDAQIGVIPEDAGIAKAYISNVDTTNHTFRLDYYGVSEGTTYINFVVGSSSLAMTEVTIQTPVISAVSNLQYTNPTADGGEVYSRGDHTPVTFEYTPTNGTGGLTITKTGGTKVDGTAWDTPGRDADQSISAEGIDYNNGVATLNCYVDNEASVGQRGSWRIAVENDPNEYLDVKITFANEPAPSTNYTITVEVNDNTMGSVDIPSVTAPFDTSISYNGNQVTIGSTTVTATANPGYQQRGRSNMIFTVIEDSTIMAEFEPQTPGE